MKAYGEGERADSGALSAMFRSLSANRYLEERITTAIVGEDEIADAASAELSDIRRKLRVANAKVREALQKIISRDPWYYSAVLMDIQMPVMDGYEATERIRALTDRSKASIPIIAMTANAFKEDRKRAAESGMDAYITKPVDVLALRYVLRRVLR